MSDDLKNNVSKTPAQAIICYECSLPIRGVVSDDKSNSVSNKIKTIGRSCLETYQLMLQEDQLFNSKYSNIITQIN